MSSAPTKQEVEAEELNIDMPWGHVAAKRWHARGHSDREKRPLVALHGWLDNAASFDGLAPLLPLDKHDVIAIDFPGHGFSSKYPDGMSYKASDALVVLKRMHRHFGWQDGSMALVGHSMGAGVASMFAAIFPNLVERVALLDLIGMVPTKVSKTSRATAKALNEQIQIMDKMASAKPPQLEHTDAVAKAFMANNLIHGMGSITREAVETIMTRGLKKVEGTELYTWTADFRLRIPSPFKVGLDQVEHFTEQIKCPLLVVKATDSPWYMSEEEANRILHVYKTHNPNFTYVKVEGGHHVHLNEPNKVGPVLKKFLLKDFTSEDTKEENLPFDLI